MADNRNDIPMGWDDEIENDGEGFRVLPEGEYDFTVENYTRARYDGDKMKPCPMAEVSIRIHDKDGDVTIIENLYLNKKFEWKLCQFFTAIGARKRGEQFHMNWNIVKGATGRCKIFVDKWTGKNGKEYEGNKISAFLEPDSVSDQVSDQRGQSSGYTQEPLTSAAQPRKWVPGSFGN